MAIVINRAASSSSNQSWHEAVVTVCREIVSNPWTAFLKLTNDLKQSWRNSDTEYSGEAVLPSKRNYYYVTAAIFGLGAVWYLRRKQREESPSRPLYVDLRDDQWPIVYSPNYNISFCGLENCHPFDSKKWGRVFEILRDRKKIRLGDIVQPVEISKEELLVVHSEDYINSLTRSYNVARVTEVPFVACIPNCIVQRVVLRPFRYQTAGTIIAAHLSLKRGWAINIGGGFHHCSANRGGGFCAYADITLAIKYMFRDHGIQKAMIIDLDAHQGNGHERDFTGDPNVYILDMYNGNIYPEDEMAKDGIRRKVELYNYEQDSEYLPKVREHVKMALDEFAPELVIYNAGTDILQGDALGRLAITANGIIERDQIVFELVRERNIPIVMVTSGGYQRQTAEIIGDSILNLMDKGFIALDSDGS